MVFLIAECGINWRDLVDADQMIKAAAEAGADACKFQAYEPFYEPGKYNGLVHPRAAELNAIRLDESTIRYLYWRCQRHGIEFMATPFYTAAVQTLNPYVKRWKIRYSDRHNEALIGLCLDTGKEILISRDKPLERKEWGDQIKTLYCCPEYPPKGEPRIFAYGNTPAMLQEAGFDGYSCHIPNGHHIHFAVTHNDLKYLEVHVRLDHYEPPHYCPIDTSVSITMSELAELCQRLKT